MTGFGYVREHRPEHPAADKLGFVLQHRLVAEIALGRYLRSDEVVHHKDRNRRNNLPDNLQVMTNSEHTMLHAKEDDHKIPMGLDSVRMIVMESETTLLAAAALGVNHETLRRRFGHLLRKRPTPSDPSDPEVLRKIRDAAADPAVGFREFAKSQHMSAMFVKRQLELHGIEWVKKNRVDRGRSHNYPDTRSNPRHRTEAGATPPAPEPQNQSDPTLQHTA